MGFGVRVIALCMLGACVPARSAVDAQESPIRMGSTAFRHAGAIFDFQFSPDGKRVATIGADLTLRLWEVPGGRELFTVRAGYPLLAVRFNRTGSALALAGVSPDIRFFDVPSGKERPPVHTKEHALYDLAFAPKGEAWAAAGGVAGLLWERESEAEPRLLHGHLRGVRRLVFSSDGQTLATSGGEDHLCLWKLPNPKTPVQLKEDRFNPMVALAYSPDGSTLAAAAGHGIRIWNLKTGSIATTIKADRNVTSVAWSPDGKLITAGVEGDKVQVWDLAEPEKPRQIAAGDQEIRKVSFSPDGKLIAAGGREGSLRFWSTENAAPVTIPEEGHRSVVTSIVVRRPNGPIISAARDGQVLFWDPAGKRLQSHESTWAVRALALSPDGLLASAGNNHYVRFWHLERGHLLNAIEDTDGAVAGLAFTAEPVELIVAQNNRVRAWSMRNRTFRETLVDNIGPVESFVIDDTGNRVAWSERSGIAVLDLDRDRKAAYFRGHANTCSGVAFLPGGRLLATVGGDGTLRIVDIATGAASESATKAELLAVACSNDGRTALTGGGDGRLRLWELASGKEILSVSADDSAVRAVSYGLTDRSILAGTSRGLVVMWNVDRELGAAAVKIDALASEDPAEAWRAMNAAGADALPLLKERLTTAPEPSAAGIERLDDADFAVRDRAARDLEWSATDEDLRAALEGNPWVERKLRLEAIQKERLLPRIRSTRGLFAVRAIAVLERLQAREVLESLAKQTATRTGAEARRALGRLK